MLNTVFGGLLRAEGSAKRSTAVQMSVAIFNMILDPFLIYSLDLGLMGAGLVTVISSAGADDRAPLVRDEEDLDQHNLGGSQAHDFIERINPNSPLKDAVWFYEYDQ